MLLTTYDIFVPGVKLLLLHLRVSKVCTLVGESTRVRGTNECMPATGEVNEEVEFKGP